MAAAVCDLCGTTKEGLGRLVKHGALGLCGRCAGLFGERFGLARDEEPGSLAAVAVEPRADLGPERSTLAVPCVEASKTPTCRVPALPLDDLMREIDDAFDRSSAPAASQASRHEPPSPTPHHAARARTFDASVWGKGIMASTGIALAVMIAFLSIKSTLPKAAGTPAALALEAAPVHQGSPPPADPERQLQDWPSVPAIAPATREAPPPPVAAPAPPIRRAPAAASKHAPVRPVQRSSDAGVAPVIDSVPGHAPESMDPVDPGANVPIPDFGGRD
jgi:hypothetical protein